MNDYAVVHPRLDVVAIVTAPSSLAAMIQLMRRDRSWGEVGINEVVFLAKTKAALESFSFWGADDSEPRASIADVIAEVRRRRDEKGWGRRAVEKLFCAAFGPKPIA